MSLVFKTPKSTLNTTTGEGQNIGYGDCPECPECPKVELSDVDVKYTENGEYTLTPEGDGFSSVGITVNIDTQAIEDAAYAEGEAAGIITGKAQGVAEQKAKLETATFVSNGTYTKEDGYNEVTVDVDTTTPYNEGVAAGIAEQKAKLTSLNVTSNGTYNKEDGYNAVTVDVQPELEAKTVSYASNGEYTITPTTGKYGISEATITIDVPSDVNNQDKTVSPTTSSQLVTADSGYSGLGTVTVEAVTSSIDANIAAGNIKKDVSILGVTGSYDPQPDLETKTVTYTANNTYTIIPTAGKDGISLATVTVNVPSSGATVETGATYTADTIGTHTIEPSKGYDGMDSVELTVNTDPLGSLGSPFDDYLAMLKIDFEGGCYYSNIASGRINETTGYYDAENGAGEVLHIKPYISDGGDPATYSFPEDFDLRGKEVVVYFLKENATLVTDEKSGDVIGVDIKECELVSINGNVNSETWPFGTLRVTENGSVDPTGYAEINVEVNPTLQTKSVVPSDRQQVITPDRDYDGLSEVTVSGVTAAIDQNITASNIKDGVTILGVTGTYDPQPSLESKTASYTANGTYTITPSTGYDGMDEVEVTVNVAGGSGTQCPDWSTIGWDCNDVTAVGIDADLAHTVQKMQNDPGPAINNSYWNGDPDLVYLPAMRIDRQNNMFLNDCSLRYVSSGLYFFAGLDEDWGYTVYGNGDSMFKGCSALRTINLDCTVTGDPNLVIFSSNNMFNGCKSLKSVTLKNLKSNNCTGMFQVCENLTTISLINCSAQPTSVQAMFNGCRKLTSVPQIDTSLCTDFKIMFSNCKSLTTVPVLDFSKATNINSIFGTNSTTGEPELTTLGGFTNLGKAFNGTSITNHILDLRFSPKLTKESIMNVINNLAAPDDTAVTDAQLMLSATSYALLTEEDIAIATAKRWSVVSA